MSSTSVSSKRRTGSNGVHADRGGTAAHVGVKMRSAPAGLLCTRQRVLTFGRDPLRFEDALGAERRVEQTFDAVVCELQREVLRDLEQ